MTEFDEVVGENMEAGSEEVEDVFSGVSNSKRAKAEDKHVDTEIDDTVDKDDKEALSNGYVSKLTYGEMIDLVSVV
jgi:hypothetical protein